MEPIRPDDDELRATGRQGRPPPSGIGWPEEPGGRRRKMLPAPVVVPRQRTGAVVEPCTGWYCWW